MSDVNTRVEGPYLTRDFTVTAATAIAQGTMLKYADPRTASLSTGTGDPFAGMSASEKDDTVSTNMGVIQTGVWVLTAGTGSAHDIVAGQKVKTAAFVTGNRITPVTGTEVSGLSHDIVVGTALESIAGGSTGEVDIGKK